MRSPIQILGEGPWLHHSAVTVPDLVDARDLILAIFAGEEVHCDRVTSAHRDLATDFGCAQDADFEVSLLKLGSSQYLELFAWSITNPAEVAPRPWVVGGHHIGFEVEDAVAAYSFLETIAGIRLLGGPKRLPEHHPLAGVTWFYFETEWGLRMELMSRDSPIPGQN
jgi:hypothetical protein